MSSDFNFWIASKSLAMGQGEEIACNENGAGTAIFEIGADLTCELHYLHGVREAQTRCC